MTKIAAVAVGCGDRIRTTPYRLLTLAMYDGIVQTDVGLSEESCGEVADLDFRGSDAGNYVVELDTNTTVEAM